MNFTETPLKGSYLIDLELFTDDRGFFSRYFCEGEFSSNGLNIDWPQINNSMSLETGTLRGLHFQNNPYTEVKLVRCISGSIWDVIVDLREDSNTYGRWFGANLTSKNRSMMYVPAGFAHGFISLEEKSEVLYLSSQPYTPNAEGILAWNDPKVSIKWPVSPKIVSAKDSQGALLDNIKPIKT